MEPAFVRLRVDLPTQKPLFLGSSHLSRCRSTRGVCLESNMSAARRKTDVDRIGMGYTFLRFCHIDDQHVGSQNLLKVSVVSSHRAVK
jgi:hypothetical protein